MSADDFCFNAIHHADANLALQNLPDEIAALIITDPPYDHSADGCFGALDNYHRILKPGGAMVFLLGQEQVPVALAAITRLRYYWIGWLASNGTNARLWGKKIMAGGKPFLWFVKEPYDYKNKQFTWDTITSSRRDKRFHVWGQSTSFAVELIEKLTSPGDLVLDPFTGGGTFLAVAKTLGRQWLGFDKDPDSVSISTARLEQTYVPLRFSITAAQSELFDMSVLKKRKIRKLKIPPYKS